MKWLVAGVMGALLGFKLVSMATYSLPDFLIHCASLGMDGYRVHWAGGWAVDQLECVRTPRDYPHVIGHLDDEFRHTPTKRKPAPPVPWSPQPTPLPVPAGPTPLPSPAGPEAP